MFAKFIIVGALLAVTLAIRDEWEQTELDCFKELSLNPSDFEDIRDALIMPEDNIDYQNLAECYWVKKNFYGENGEINHDVIRDVIRKQIVAAFAEKNYDDAKVLEIFDAAMDKCSQINYEGSRGLVALKKQNCCLGHMVTALENL